VTTPGVDGPRKRLLFAPRLDRVPPKLQKLSLQATKSYSPGFGNPDVSFLVGRHRGMRKPSLNQSTQGSQAVRQSREDAAAFKLKSRLCFLSCFLIAVPRRHELCDATFVREMSSKAKKAALDSDASARYDAPRQGEERGGKRGTKGTDSEDEKPKAEPATKVKGKKGGRRADSDDDDVAPKGKAAPHADASDEDRGKGEEEWKARWKGRRLDEERPVPKPETAVIPPKGKAKKGRTPRRL